MWEKRRGKILPSHRPHRMIIDRLIPIISNKKIAKEIFLTTFRHNNVSSGCVPGQFVQIKIDDARFLRRPLSIHRVKGDMFSVLYKIKGEGTRLLSEKKKKENLRVLGPLGNGFILQKSLLERFDKILIVAGGMGIAPMLFLLDCLKQHNNKHPEVFFGACTKEEVILKQELRETGFPVHYATDDCSFGSGGMVTRLLEQRLRECAGRKVLIYACGPEAMYYSLQKIMGKFSLVTVEALFERMMGCGFGVCNSCSILTRDGMKKVCTDGPAFNLANVVLG